jgi:hypothetical protein
MLAGKMPHCHHNRAVRAALIVGCLFGLPRTISAAQMAANLDRDTVYLGTQTLLVVDVANATAVEWPVIAPVDGLQITHYGNPSATRDLFSGAVQRRYRFLVNPSRTGEFTIPSVTLGAGAAALKQGPFRLRVLEAALKFLAARVEPEEVCPGESAVATITYQGFRQGKELVLPTVQGLEIRSAGPPRIELTESEGMPVSIYRLEISAAQAGAYPVKGVSLDGVAADVFTLKVSPFVIVGAQVGDTSLVVGGQTLVHVVVRGLPASPAPKLVAPAGLKIVPSRERFQGPQGATVFSFDVTASEPGSPVITTLQLADGRAVALPKPVTLSVRQGGEGDILQVRGKARSPETVVGEPFIVDYEVYFRGDLQAAGIDPAQAEFANRPYIKVEPLSDPRYDGWAGQPIEVGFGAKSRIVLLSGSGDLNGRKEQLLRFAVKITPLAAGDLELKGLRVILRLLIKEERRTGISFFQSTRTQDYAREIDVPAHRVVDPPGKTVPTGYRGAVGSSFRYATSLDRTTATAMSPLTLTMKITGESVGAQFKPPPLADIPEVARDFDVSPSVGGGELQGDTITFTRVIRPRSESVKELPSLPLVYYDYVKREYQTVYSLPIPIMVSAGSLVGATAMQTKTLAESSPSGAPTPQAPGAEAVALCANYTTMDEAAGGEPLGPVGVSVVLLGGPCGIAGVWFGRRWRQRRRPSAAIRRQRRELSDALESLAGRDDFCVRLAELVQSCLRLTFALPAGEISAMALVEAMDRKAVDGDLRREVQELLARCDTGRFAATRVDDAEKRQLADQARRLFARLERV